MKTDPAATGAVLYQLMETLRHIGWLLYPFMPDTAEKILTGLGVFAAEEKVAFTELSTWGRWSVQPVTKPTNLFLRH